MIVRFAQLLGLALACLRSAVTEPATQLTLEPSLRRLSRHELGVVRALEVPGFGVVAVRGHGVQ